MRDSRFLFVLFFCLVLHAARSRAQTKPVTPPVTPSSVAPPANPKTPAEFFARARQLSDLEASGIPFHLKATFVASGDAEFLGNGTYEEWWRDKDHWRKEATLGSYRYVSIHNGQEQVAAATSAYIPLRVREAMSLRVLHIANPKNKDAKWTLVPMTQNSKLLETVEETEPCDPSYKAILCTKNFEFAADGTLQFYRDYDLSELYSSFQPFEKLLFPRNTSVTLRGERLLAVHIFDLTKLSDNDHTLFDTKSLPDLQAKPSPLAENIPAKGVTPPKLIHNAHPKYPRSERKHRPNSIVVVACMIDVRGRVREPYVLRSGGAAFDQSAMRTIEKWRFAPALVNGVPGMVDTNIVVDFRVR